MTTTISKKLINTPNDCVDDNLEGFVGSKTNVSLLKGYRVIVRSDVESFVRSGKVAILSGGGSGHEPLFAGFVGKGCLTAAVAGHVFTSPPPSHILAALKALQNSTGTLVFVINYTGDRLNFGLAVERARARLPNNPIRVVTLGEDTALTSKDRSAGRRGLAASVMIIKIAGAMSEQGFSLDQIANFCENASSQSGTIGLSLSSCSLPGSGPIFHLEPDLMELGLGVHGEPGVSRVPLTSARRAIDLMMCHMTNPESSTHLAVSPGDEVAVLLNNLGGTSQIEMSIICKDILMWLGEQKVKVLRFYCGAFMTSLEMHGISISLLKVDSQSLKYLDAQTECSAWPVTVYPHHFEGHRVPDRVQPPGGGESEQAKGQKLEQSLASLSPENAEVFKSCIQAACEELCRSESRLNSLDQECGDGDCGSTLRHGAQAITLWLGSTEVMTIPSLAFEELSDVWEGATGGTSGPVYSLLFSGFVQHLRDRLDPGSWLRGLKQGIESIMKYGAAQPGDRTMIDALTEAIKAVEGAVNNGAGAEETLASLAKGARKGADETAQMRAGAGRASYVAPERLRQADPGAEAVALWCGAIANCFKLSTMQNKGN